MPAPSLILSEEAIILLLLATAIVLSVVLAKVRFPYTIGLVIIGYVLAAFIAPAIPFLAPLSGFVPSSDVILFLFLPPLIFQSAITLDSRRLAINLGPILMLAIAGLVISAIVVGMLLVYISPLPLILALLFGAFISATDPVAVISLFRELGVPRKLQTLVEGESLFNDASAIVVFNLIMGVILVQSTLFSPTIVGITADFVIYLVISFAGGIIIGGVLALAVSAAIQASPSHPHIHQTVSLVVAYGAFLISQLVFGFSGVIAVLIAGIVVSRTTSQGRGIHHRQELTRFWEYIGFLADTLIFVLVGLSITSLADPVLFTAGFALAAVLVVIAVLVARAFSVYGLFSLFNLFHRKRKIPFSYQTIIFWGGLRGAVALALVLALPVTLPYRDLLVGFTIVVVIFTILVSGTTIRPLIRALGLSRPEAVKRFEDMYLEVLVRERAVESLHDLSRGEEPALPPHSAEETVQRYGKEKEKVLHEFSVFWKQLIEGPHAARTAKYFLLAAIDDEKRRYIRMFDVGLIPGLVMDQLLYDAETRYDRVQLNGQVPGTRVYVPALARALRLIRSALIRLPGFGTNAARLEREEYLHMLFRSYASFSVARQTRDWMSRVVAKTGATWEVLDRIIQDYHQVYLDSKAEFERLSSQYPELLEVMYRYIADRLALTAGKEILTVADGDHFVTDDDIEDVLTALEKEEFQVSKRLTKV